VWFAAGCSGFQPQTTFDDGGLPTTPQTLAENRNRPQDLVVKGGFVYWVEQGSFMQSATDGRVLRAPIGGCKDASCPEILAQDVYSPGGITVSLDGTLLFYCELGTGPGSGDDGRIWRIELGGDETPMVFAQDQGGPRKLAVDETAVYWVNGRSGEVRRSWLDGSLPDGAIATSQGSPVEITASVALGAVFWTNYGSSDFGGLTVGADVNGDNLGILATGQAQPRGLSLGPTYLYWANFGSGTVMRARPDGSDLAAFASDRLSPNDVLVDGDWLLVAEAGSAPFFRDGRILAMRLDGSETRILAEDQRHPRSLAVDGDAVYWVNVGTTDHDQYDGALLRVKKP
jgi:sugar lactone lactonase YvrE